jgi:hypothetical protein
MPTLQELGLDKLSHDERRSLAEALLDSIDVENEVAPL